MEDKETESMVFIVKYEEEFFDERGKFFYDTFYVNIEDTKSKLERNIFSFYDEDKEKMIDHYAYEIQPFEEIVNYEVAETSISEYGKELCCAVILHEINWFGMTEEDREKRISEFKEELEESIEEAEKGNTVPAEEVFEELHQKILDDCKLDEEREYILLEREFDKKTEEFRQNYMRKVMERNYNRAIEMLKKSFEQK